MLTGLDRAWFFLASCTLAASAHASYGQMRLDGVGLVLAFLLMIACCLVVDLALFARLFRHRIALVIGFIVAVAVCLLFLGQAVGYFRGYPGGAELVLLVVTSAVVLPFIVAAPFGQHLAMRHGRRWPGWIPAWMALQLALLPAFVILAFTDEHYRQREYAVGQAEGSQVKAGGLGALLELADRRHERIWGTGWTNPWLLKPPPGSYPRPSGWSDGLARGIGASALIAANEPLNEPDRAALRALMERHLISVPATRAKLVWDALEPGRFARQLAPRGLDESGVVDEEVIPVLLERLEKYGELRLCPGGRMVEADRAVLNALVLKKGRAWNVEKRDHEMRPDWVNYQRQVERLCQAK